MIRLPLEASLRRDASGMAAVEFGLIAPVLLLMIFGMLEMGYRTYVDSILKGAVQAAGRSSGLESGNAGQASIDQMVRDRVLDIVPNAAITFERRNYVNFVDVGRPEDFEDTNGNNEYDVAECFDDENANAQWDSDAGRDGQGSANEVVRFTARVAYPSFIPIAGAFGLSNDNRLSASTTLRNQPFATQPTRQLVQICP